VATGAVLLNGAVHLHLYMTEYHGIHIVGTLFLLNAIAAGVIAAGLLVTRWGAVGVSAIAFSVATVSAFALSRTNGLFGFREIGVDGWAIVALLSEVAAVAALAVWFIRTRPQDAHPAVIGERVPAAEVFEQAA
jgi:hypothetical protein